MTLTLLDLFQSAPQPGPAGGLIQFLPMIFIFVVFYFLLIAPMRKKQKKQQQMLSQLKRGDEVVTASGILGRIAALDDANGIVVLQIAEYVTITVLRSAIAGPAGEPEATSAPAAS
jgi:preprotein translocase subunit YajC